MILRDYQDEAVQSIFSYFETNFGNPCVGMPTGTGKSLVIAGFLQRVFQSYWNQRVMVLTHVKELIEQNHQKLMSLWPQAPAGVNSAGLKRRDYQNPIIFAGIASVARNPQAFGHVDLLVVDEAHLVSPDESTMYAKFIAALKEVNPLLKVVGMTATPWRMGHGHITDGGLFTDMCIDLTAMEPFNRFIAEGYLMPLVAKSTTTYLDLEGVHMRGNDLNLTQLQAAVDKEHITRAALAETYELGRDRHSWLVFASGVEHAIHCADMLNSFGVRAVAIHGKMSAKDRDAAIQGFKAGYYRAAVNNNVLTTGFDHPGIDLISMIRPTMSTPLWVQMLGRGTRPLYMPGFNINTFEGRMQAIANSYKQDCLVLDFARNSSNLGPINDPVLPRKRGEKGGDAPVKYCPCCPVINHPKARYCGGKPKDHPEYDSRMGCGTEFVFVPKIDTTASTKEVMKGDLPIVEEFKVDLVTYSLHRKVGSASSLKVSYHSGLRMFNEFVCLAHEGKVKNMARRWWESRSELPAPDTIEDALEHAATLKAPTHVRVWTNQKYPSILAHCFDGTCFGKLQQVTNAPATQVHQVKDSVELKDNVQDNQDEFDDIPY